MTDSLSPGIRQTINPYDMSDSDREAFRQAVDDWNSNSGGKDLAEFMFARALAVRAQSVQHDTGLSIFPFPRPSRGMVHNGWSIDPKFINSLVDEMRKIDEAGDFVPSMEQAETVLLALESLVQKGGLI